MFLHLLTDEQQRAWCRAAQWLVDSDGVTDAREHQWLEHAIREMGLDPVPEGALTRASMTDELAVFTNPLRKRLAMLEWVMLAAADGLISPQEVAILRVLGDVFEISRAELGQAHDLAVKARQTQELARQWISKE